MTRRGMGEGGAGVPADDPGALLARFQELAEEGRWESAAELLREGLEAFPDAPEVHCWLGVAERELGLDGIAYERFRRALALQPEDPHILAVAGSGVAEFDDPDAEPALRAAALLAPQVAETRWRYGAFLSREGLLDDALRELEAARDLDPSDPVVFVELGVAHALREDWERASWAFGEAVTLAPEDGWPRILLGLAELEQDALPEAAQELEAGARLRPEDVDAQLLAALAAAAVDQEGVALELLERARMVGQGPDLLLAGEVEDRVDGGAGSSLAFLRTEMGPSSLRERLMARP